MYIISLCHVASPVSNWRGIEREKIIFILENLFLIHFIIIFDGDFSSVIE